MFTIALMLLSTAANAQPLPTSDPAPDAAEAPAAEQRGFFTGAGVGYKFRRYLHAVLKYEHLSNAGIGDYNRSANSIGLGIGYMF